DIGIEYLPLSKFWAAAFKNTKDRPQKPQTRVNLLKCLPQNGQKATCMSSILRHDEVLTRFRFK
uniref:Uncharacterized protein n=1 Tax=Takifugu rubripes TaxID=31033 RepID=A0A674NET5_TAKRU